MSTILGELHCLHRGDTKLGGGTVALSSTAAAEVIFDKKLVDLSEEMASLRERVEAIEDRTTAHECAINEVCDETEKQAKNHQGVTADAQEAIWNAAKDPMQTELASVWGNLENLRLTPTPCRSRAVVSLTPVKPQAQRFRANSTSFNFSALKKRGTKAVTETPPIGKKRKAEEPAVMPPAKMTRREEWD